MNNSAYTAISYKIANFFDRNHIDGPAFYSKIPLEFIYCYGPYMAMTPGYEKYVDEISKYNNDMNIIRLIAWSIRMNASQYIVDKDTLRSYTIAVGKAMPHYDKNFESLRQCIIADVADCVERKGKLVAITKAATTESTTAVAADEKIKEIRNMASRKVILGYIDQCCNKIKNMTSEEKVRLVRSELFSKTPLEITSIVRNANDILSIATDTESWLVNHTIAPDISKLLPIDFDTFRADAIKYYILASLVLATSDELRATQNRCNLLEAVEASITDNTEISLESFLGTSADLMTASSADIDEGKVREMINKGRDTTDESEGYDIDSLRAYIYQNTYHLFGSDADDWFTQCVDMVWIKSISNFEEWTIHEMIDGTIAVPYTDLRDYAYRVIIMDVQTGNIYTIDDPDEFYK